MRVFDRFRSLHGNVLLWLIAPFTLILAAALGTIIYLFQNNTTQLVLERHQQMANLAAVTVSQGIEGDAHLLEALRDQALSPELPAAEQSRAFSPSPDALVDFSGGVIWVDGQGNITAAVADLPLAQWAALPDAAMLEQIDAAGRPVFSDVVVLPDGKKVILIGVPVLDERGGLSGAIVGGIDIGVPQNSISTAVQKLTSSMPGIAYLVDRQGVVISHPDPAEIGQHSGDYPVTRQAVSGSRGRLWKAASGAWFVGAEAQVQPAGWSVVVKEPWDAIIAPARRYTLLILGFVLLALALFVYLSWLGTRKVTLPIQKLSDSTQRIAAGEPVPEITLSGITEIDDLHAAYAEMARQIAAYRDGLRHYVGEITRSQEEERLRISRELHDDTIQNLLAVYRRAEFISATETDESKRQQLESLQVMIGQTLEGVRLISQDLRPMMLDDLGFVPAVQMLVRQAHEGRGAVPDARLDVRGTPQPLPAGVELAMYRIVQEALSNVRKHAHATSVAVTIDYQLAFVRLTVADDGAGFVVPASFTELVQSSHLGLMGIQERVWAVDGRLEVESVVDQGTKIKIIIPVQS